MVITLDAAAPFAGHLPARNHLVYFVTHPCHPPIFNDESTPEGRHDHFGSLYAKQSIVSALMQGPDEAFAHIVNRLQSWRSNRGFPATPA